MGEGGGGGCGQKDDIVFSHEECGNLKVFVDGGELTGNINK